MENIERIGRLLMARQALKEIKLVNRFDLRKWSAHAGRGRAHLDDERQPGCGTVVCACGYFGLRAEFNQLGFHLSDRGTLRYGDDVRLRNWDAVTAFFGFESWDAAAHIFAHESYRRPGDRWRPVTPAEVIERIDDLLEEIRGDKPRGDDE